MFKYKSIALVVLSASICLTLAETGAQEALKSSKFLEYPAASQRSYITSSAMMAGVIATQNMPSQAKCIDEWATTRFEESTKSVTTAMERFPDHHPTTVIFAVLQKACGSFKYTK